jgi:hypothetical protein
MLQLHIFYATNIMWFCYFSIILVLQCLRRGLRRGLLRVSSEVSSKVSGESLVRSPARSPTRFVFDVFFCFIL